MSLLPTIRGVPINHRFFPVYSLSSSQKNRSPGQPSHSRSNSYLAHSLKTNSKPTRTYVVETFCFSCGRCVDEREILLLQDDQEGCTICHPNHQICDRCGYGVPEDLQISNEGKICDRCSNSHPDAKNDGEMDIPNLDQIECIKVLEPYINRMLAVKSPKS
jgi:hypothetical protein